VIKGIDVSNRQGTIIWPQVAASGIEFAICKASEGIGFADPYLRQNLAGAAAFNVAPAAYHFALPATSDPTQNARWFRQCAEPYLQDGMPAVLDLEDDPYGHTIPDDLGPWALEWLTVVERALGIKPLIYTDLDIILNHGLNNAAFGDYGLWLAYPAANLPQIPPPWTYWAL
jgi:lysozyme